MALLPFAYTAFSLLKGLTFQRLGFYSSALQQSSCLRAFAVLERGIETLLMWVSYTNRSSSWPRFWIGCLLVLSFIVPVVIQNEPRNFNPAFADPQFQILQPEPLCPAPLFQGPGGGGGRLQGFEETAHDDGDEGNGTTQGTKTFDEYWKEYVEFHKQMVLPEHLGGIPHKSKNFLVFTPSDDGLGNRLQALLSTVVLAMVTKRAIVLDWRATPQCKAEFLDLFQQPDGIAWDFWSVWNRNPDTHANHQRSTPVTIPGEWLPYCRGCLLRDPITPSSMWSRMLCGTDLGVDESQPWKEIISTQWFLPVIQHNPIWRAELCRMFPEGDHKNAFQLLAKKILRPSATVQSQIDSVLTRIPRDVTTLIGLQVRRTENNAAGGYNIEESFLTCADQVVDEEIERSDRAWMARQKQKGRHQKQRIDDGNIKNRAPTTVYNRLPTELEEMWIEREKRKNQPKFAYILATDYHPTRLHFQEILGDELYVLENTFQSATATAHGRQQRQQQHDDHDEQQQLQQQEQQQLQQQQKQQQHLSTANTIDSSHRIGLLKHSNQLTSNTSSAMDAKSTTQNSQRAVVARNSVQGVQMAVAEMFLLAHADRIIASPYSTFGYFAHGYANVQPNIVKRDGTCIHRKSTQPCFQYWFGFANGGASCPIKATIEMSEDYDCWL
ncbi:hypothetical protein BG004_004324 [Podila humilis]|nr:hypothetical protein BG004_004324 [Podila humilis]